jgi:hypothetical protein
MSPTPRTFRLGEPTPGSLRGLTPSCHAKLPGSSFHLVPSGPRPAEAVRCPPRARHLRSPRELSVCPVDTRAPSTGLIPTLRQSSRNAERNRTNVIDRVPSSHRTGEPAWSRHWANHHAAIPPSTPAAFAPRAYEKRHLSPSLCNRRVFKCTQGNISFPGGGSRLLESIRSDRVPAGG